MHCFRIGQTVQARMQSICLGRGTIVSLEVDNNKLLYLVQTADGQYPLYEHELKAI